MLLGTLECDGGVRRRAGPLRPLARTRGDRVPAANNRRAKRGSIRCAKGGADKWHQATCPQVLNLTLTYNEDPVGPFPGQVIDMRSGSAGDLTRRATGVTPAEHQTFVGGIARGVNWACLEPHPGLANDRSIWDRTIHHGSYVSNGPAVMVCSVARFRTRSGLWKKSGS